jgi:phage tail sheath protein FI
MVTEYRHGIQTVEVDDGIRPIETGQSNVIGLIGTAPDADVILFPLDTPVLIAGNPRQAVELGNTGTLKPAIDAIFDQFGADVIVVRVEEDVDLNGTLSNFVGDVTQLTGVHAFKKAQPMLRLVPKILIAPGYTAQRVTTGIVSVALNTAGANYGANTVATVAGDGTAAALKPVIGGGVLTSVLVKKPGFQYTSAPITITDPDAVAAKQTFTFTGNAAEGETVTIDGRVYTITADVDAVNEVLLGADADATILNLIAAINAGAGSGTAYGVGTLVHATVTASAGVDTTFIVTAKVAGLAGNAKAVTDAVALGSWGAATLAGGLGGSGATATATLGTVANPVVAELIGLAEDMRAIIIADTPGTSYEDAIAYRGDFDTDRLWLVEGGVQVWDVIADGPVVQPVAGRLAGKQAYMDENFGFWYSASNQSLNGVIGVNRVIDWSYFSSTVEGQLLNSQGIAVVVHDDGFRVMGVRSPTSKALWKFVSVRRTADMVYDSIELAMREAVDKPINLGLLDWISGSVNAYLRKLAALGAIIDGRAWLDPTLNPVQDLQDGKLTIDFDIEPPAPLERLTFRAHRNSGYYQELLDNFVRNAA